MKASRVALCAIVVVTSACSRSGRDASFHWTSNLPAGAVVHIRDVVGSINVTRVNGPVATAQGTRSWHHGRRRDVDFVVNQVGNDYYLCAMWKNSGECTADGYNSRRRRNFLAIFSLFRHGSDAKADFEVNIPSSVGVDAKTASGSVTINGASGGVSAETANGSVTASNVSGSLMLKTANGSVHVTATALGPTDAIDLETANGNVRAELPAGTDGKFSLSTINGSVKTDFPLPVPENTRGAIKNIAGQIGTSTRALNMHTMNGSVVVTSRPATASQ